METQTADDEVAVDLGWKTQQDKGRWIDKMGIADDVNSLVLIINNIENDTDTVKTNTGNGSSDKVVKVKKKTAAGEFENALPLQNGKTGFGRRISLSTVIFPAHREKIPIFTAFTAWKAPLETKMIGKSRPVS